MEISDQGMEISLHIFFFLLFIAPLETTEAFNNKYIQTML